MATLRGRGIIKLTATESRLWNLIKQRRGQADSIAKSTINARLGIEDRAIRSLIHDLREIGFPIASNSKHSGYYVPANKEEADVYKKEIHSRIQNLNSIIDAVDNWNNPVFG